jgi:hypothetical protein
MSIRKFITAPVLAGAIAATFAFGTNAGASAPGYASPEVGMQVLDKMCVEQDGQVYNTPYTISRCQEARSRDGFEIEALVCEGLLGGTFHANPAIGRVNRTNWACVSGPS